MFSERSHAQAVHVLPRSALAPRLSATPAFKGLASGSNATTKRGFHDKDLLTGDTPRVMVTIHELDATGSRNWASAVYAFEWVPVTDPAGKVQPAIDYPGLPVDHRRTERRFGVPIRPHFGSMGLAPKEAEVVNSILPSTTGGNIGNWRIGRGATAYCPVAVPGALRSVGDQHASQGDSELCGTPLERLDVPVIETAEDWAMPGCGDPNDLAELGPGAQDAIFAKSPMNLADVGITQAVDGNRGTHAVIKKTVFAGRRDAIPTTPLHGVVGGGIPTRAQDPSQPATVMPRQGNGWRRRAGDWPCPGCQAMRSALDHQPATRRGSDVRRDP